MASQLESTSALERRLSLSVSLDDVGAQVDRKLREMSRSVRMPGFRPGKVPLTMVAQSYGPKVQAEVMDEAVNRAFSKRVAEEKLRPAGRPVIVPGEQTDNTQLVFTAVFEVFPEIVLGDAKALQIERVECEVTEADIDRTLDVLRRQNVAWQLPADGVVHTAGKGDRITLDFSGKLDGVEFAGGSAQDFTFVLGEGRMLADFEAGLTGLAVGAPHSFPVTFPAEYGAEHLAGKTVTFDVTIKAIELPQLPELNNDFVTALGVAEGTVEALRQAVRTNLESQVAKRIAERHQRAAMQALPKLASFELPQALVQGEAENLCQQFLQSYGKAARGKAVEATPADFSETAHHRVRLGLLIAELVRQQGLQAKPEQVRQHLEHLARDYDQPGEMMRQFLGNPERMREIEAVVLEKSVVDWVLTHAQVTARSLSLEELMAGDGTTEGVAS